MNEEYEKYLRSEYWKQLRAKVIKRDCKCLMCGKNAGLVVHHLSYSDISEYGKDNGIEHLITLCRKCHNDVHTFPGILKESADCSNLEQSVDYRELSNKSKSDSDYSNEYNALVNIARTVNHRSVSKITDYVNTVKKERVLNTMVFITDAFIISRCKELSAYGDIKMFTSPTNMAVSSSYIYGLFNYAPYVSASDIWLEQCGERYSVYIKPTRYNYYRTMIKRFNEKRL